MMNSFTFLMMISLGLRINGLVKVLMLNVNRHFAISMKDASLFLIRLDLSNYNLILWNITVFKLMSICMMENYSVMITRANVSLE